MVLGEELFREIMRQPVDAEVSDIQAVLLDRQVEDFARSHGLDVDEGNLIAHVTYTDRRDPKAVPILGRNISLPAEVTHAAQ